VDLLEEIKNAAVDSKSDLGTLLRKCKLLAAQLGSKPLEDWLIWESNGYPPDVPVPDYRTWALEVKGHFAGPLGSGLRNTPIPLACLPERIRAPYERYECRQSIASIEAVVANTDGVIGVSTGDLALLVGTKVYRHHNCIQAWAEFSSNSLIELLNSVRNRVLDFAVAVGKERGPGGSGVSSDKTIDSSRVTQIFNTTIYGGSAQLVGTANQSTVTMTIKRRDFDSLEHVLRENGVKDADLLDLKGATEEEKEVKPDGGFGPKVSSWIAQMMMKAAQGTWDVGIAAAGTMLADALAKYYGLS